MRGQGIARVGVSSGVLVIGRRILSSRLLLSILVCFRFVDLLHFPDDFRFGGSTDRLKFGDAYFQIFSILSNLEGELRLENERSLTLPSNN